VAQPLWRSSRTNDFASAIEPAVHLRLFDLKLSASMVDDPGQNRSIDPASADGGAPSRADHLDVKCAQLRCRRRDRSAAGPHNVVRYAGPPHQRPDAHRSERAGHVDRLTRLHGTAPFGLQLLGQAYLVRRVRLHGAGRTGGPCSVAAQRAAA
jgi:hypothetical protein